MRDKRLAFVLLLLVPLAGCATQPYKPGYVNWSTGCDATNITSTSVVTIPCKKLVVTSYAIALGRGKKHDIYGGIVPADQVFDEIESGKVADWSWKLAGTPTVARRWRSASPASVTAAPDAASAAGAGVSWSSTFRTTYAVYRYVLAGAPPPTHFNVYLFPLDQSLSRSVTTSTRKTIVMPLYFPYYRTLFQQKSSNPVSSTVKQGHEEQLASFFTNTQLGIVGFTSCFEYMHALFLTKHLMVPNLLSHSVADWVTCLSLKGLIGSGSPEGLDIPSLKSIRAAVNKRWPPPRLPASRVDSYGGMLALENIAHLFGADKKSMVIHYNDRAEMLKLIRLARAMLQQPVDFTKQQLYPLNRLDSIPAYTGTSADIPRR